MFLTFKEFHIERPFSSVCDVSAQFWHVREQEKMRSKKLVGFMVGSAVSGGFGDWLVEQFFEKKQEAFNGAILAVYAEIKRSP